MPRTRKQIIKQKLNKNLVNNGFINISAVIQYVLKSHHIHEYQINGNRLCCMLKHEYIQLSLSSNTATDKKLNR